MGLSDCIYSFFLPPPFFIANTVKYSVMGGAEWDDPLIAHLAPKRSRLCKSQVVGMARAAATDETGLPGHIAQMLFISNAPWGADREGRFVDPAWGTFGLG